MMNQKTKFVSSILAGIFASVIAISHFSAEAQGPAADHQATSEMVNQHTHSMVITDAHLKELISSTGDTDTVTLQTSQEYNGNPKDGALHSHQVKMNKQQMQVLDAAGEVDVETDEAAGHKHYMRFYKPAQCPTTYPQPYPPQACPYGGKCQYPYPYPQVGCPPPCTTCQYPYPYPTYCPTCPTPKPCATCPPLPPPTYTSPTPTATAAPSPSGSVTPTTIAGIAPTPTASPTAPCTPGLDCECYNSPKDPHGSYGIPEQCVGPCTTPGATCFCQTRPRDPSCPAAKAGCAPTDQACICSAQPWALECRCYNDPTGPDCFVPATCQPYTQCYCGGNPRAPGCAEFFAGLPNPGVSPNPSASPIAIVSASPGATGSPSVTPSAPSSATPTPTRSPSPSATPTRSPSPTRTPTSPCDTPGTDCYCGIQGPSDPNCSVSCSTPGSTCYCNFVDPTDASCPGGGTSTSGLARTRSKR